MELSGSVPLGAARHTTYEEREWRVEPGSALVLYTDGLVERAGESLDTGLERLRAVVGDGGGDLERLGDSLVDELLPDGPTQDDAALLIVRALPLSGSLVLMDQAGFLTHKPCPFFTYFLPCLNP